jgi:hypothetical protein
MKIIHQYAGEKIVKPSDVTIVQVYLEEFKRWKETALLFKDKSILWEARGSFTYAAKGSEFIRHNRVNCGGFNGSGEEVYVDVNEYKALIKDLLVDANLIEEYYGEGSDLEQEPYKTVWEPVHYDEEYEECTAETYEGICKCCGTCTNFDRDS